MRRHCSLHRRFPTTGSNTPHSELQDDDSQRTRLRARQSVSHISRMGRERKRARRNSPTLPANESRVSESLRSGMYRGKVPANVEMPLQCCLTGYTQNYYQPQEAVRKRRPMSQEWGRTSPVFMHIIRCKGNVGKTCLVLGRRNGGACEKHCQVSLRARYLREDWPWHGKVKDDVMEWLSNSKNYVKMAYIYLYCDASGMAHP
jgi:hypothetical protein